MCHTDRALSLLHTQPFSLVKEDVGQVKYHQMGNVAALHSGVSALFLRAAHGTDAKVFIAHIHNRLPSCAASHVAFLTFEVKHDKVLK